MDVHVSADWLQILASGFENVVHAYTSPANSRTITPNIAYIERGNALFISYPLKNHTPAILAGVFRFVIQILFRFRSFSFDSFRFNYFRFQALRILRLADEEGKDRSYYKQPENQDNNRYIGSGGIIYSTCEC